MSRLNIMGAVVGSLGFLTSVGAAQAAPVCNPPKNSHEAMTMAIVAVPLAFGTVAAGGEGGSRWRAGLEVSTIPNVPPATSIPTFCRPEKTQPENTDLLAAMPRARLWVGLPAGFGFEGSWIPPIRVGQAKANLVGVALSRSTFLDRRRGATLDLRLHGSFGWIEGPITCDDDAIANPESICFQGTRSKDRFHPNVVGGEASIGWRLGRSLHPWVGAGFNHLAPRFQVNSTNQFGIVDRQRVRVNLARGVLFAGATWRLTKAFDVSGSIYGAPTDALTARVTARVGIGG